MNASLGRFTVILLLLFSSMVGAADYSYSLHLSKRSLYLKEPMVVTFDINQTDSSKVMFFDFDIDAGDSFFVHRLDKDVDEAYHARRERYTYLVYPLKSGKLRMKFDLLVRRGNDELLTTAFTGGRYNVKAVETDDRHEPLPSPEIEVKPLPVDADLAGSFDVSRTLGADEVESYEPLYIDVRVRGNGYIPDLKKIDWLPPLPGVRLFSDKPKISVSYTKEGMSVDALFRYALISQRDYEIPKLHLTAYDTVRKRAYTIDLDAVKVHVKAVEASALLDKENRPPPVESPLAVIKRFLTLFLIFSAGWISAVLTLRLRRHFRAVTEKDEWSERVKSSKDEREIMMLLLLKDADRYRDTIERLERALHKHERIDLKRIKREVLNEG
ncbi:BatD [Hydrogenimonas sp.]|nr:BatD [Hydrogenimonas sp.]